MLPHVVQVHVSLVEGPAADVTVELFFLGMALLVRPQRGAAAEALQTDLTAERRDPSGPASPLPPVFVMNHLLVFLQLTVVEERLPTHVAHERLLHTVNQHVGLQGPRPCKRLPTLITPEGLLSIVQPQVSPQVVFQAEAHAAGLTHERFLSGVNHAVL